MAHMLGKMILLDLIEKSDDVMSRKLHIGGQVKVDGWEVFNAIDADYVDHVGNAKDLSRFADETFAEIYASHVLEHFDYKDELVHVLKEWRRVLQKGGKLFISVPDIDTIFSLFLMKNKFDVAGRFAMMRNIFGGHVNEYDYHITGLNEEFLRIYLGQAGFASYQKVDRFGIFPDTSDYKIAGILASLNVIATK